MGFSQEIILPEEEYTNINMNNWIDPEIWSSGEKPFVLCKTCEIWAEYIENRYYSYITNDNKFPIIAYKIRNSENSFYALGNYSIEQVYKYKRNESD